MEFETKIDKRRITNARFEQTIFDIDHETNWNVKLNKQKESKVDFEMI